MVSKVPIPVDGAVQVAPPSLHPDVRLIDVPRGAGLATPLGTQAVGDERGEPSFPIAHRLVGELEAAFEEHLGEVAQAQLVTQAPTDDEEDDVGGELEEVEDGAGPFVEGALAG
jgi:hypothetical protein